MLNSARQKTDKIALKAIFKPADAFLPFISSHKDTKKNYRKKVKR